MLKRFKDFTRLAAEVRLLQENDAELLFSFDVFDTLIHRRVAPNAIIEAVGREVCDQLRQRNCANFPDIFISRSDAYLEAAAKLVGRDLDTDAHLDDLALPWVRKLAGGAFDGDEELAAFFIEREIALEIGSIFPNLIMRKLLQDLKQAGARVVLISDMYLGVKYVERILSAHGFEGLYEQIFVSADVGKLKRTGRLFEHVIEEMKVKPDRIVHSGDNLISDGIKAHLAGINALVIRDRVMAKRYDRLEYDYVRQKSDRSWKGVCAAAFAQAAPGVVGSPEEAYGLRVLGPIIVPFVQMVAERCKMYGIQHAYFLAREGLILKRIFQEIAPLTFNSDVQPNAQYLGVSRLSTFVAAMDENHYGLREIASALANTGHLSLRNLFQPLHIEPEKLTAIAHDAGISDIDAALPSNFLSWPPLAACLRHPDFKMIVKERASQGRAGLIGYLNDMGFFDFDRVAVVDVGWGAQIQENIAVAIEGLQDHPQIMGMYLGLNNVAHIRKTDQSWVDWALCDQGHAEWFGWAALEFVFLFEVMTRAPHGTVIGYEKCGERFEPLTKDDTVESRKIELQTDPVIANVQKGILEYSKRYAIAARIFDIQSTDAMPYARSMVARAVRFPTREEASWISRIKNVSDLGSSEIVSLSGTQLPVLRPRVARRMLATSFWPYALIRSRLGTLGQMMVAVARGWRQLPSSDQLLAPWIVWHVPSTRRSGCVPKAGLTIDNTLESRGLENMELMRNLGRKQALLVHLHERTEPLSFIEMLRLNLTYRILRVIARLKKRHVPTASCISIRGLIMRENHWNRYVKFSRSIYRRIKKFFG